MSENILIDLSKEFAVDIINATTEISDSRKHFVLTNQLLRCGTSIGANIHEANYGASKADFANKLQIALKECYETDYWLNIFKESKILSEDRYNYLYNKCCKLRRILIASINTSKKNIN